MTAPEVVVTAFLERVVALRGQLEEEARALVATHLAEAAMPWPDPTELRDMSAVYCMDMFDAGTERMRSWAEDFRRSAAVEVVQNISAHMSEYTSNATE